ncbi:hypothetical protein ACQ86K_21570 [Mucilaginibacter sp. P19]|uniref:hypothetical protein n=1 Tax=Mucilaginibacter sp. P19 TaxID=3423947 RepID=UPI003D6720FD
MRWISTNLLPSSPAVEIHWDDDKTGKRLCIDFLKSFLFADAPGGFIEETEKIGLADGY